MTTNFYLRSKFTRLYPIDRSMDELLIGKRAAAGWYCWDCRSTLCKPGNKFVHAGPFEQKEIPFLQKYYLVPMTPETVWSDECLHCGQSREDSSEWSQGLSKGSVARELGFDKSKPKGKIGIASTSSFTFALRFQEVHRLLNRLKWLRIFGKPIVDEYGRSYSVKEFMDVLEECAIQDINEQTNWC